MFKFLTFVDTTVRYSPTTSDIHGETVVGGAKLPSHVAGLEQWTLSRILDRLIDENISRDKRQENGLNVRRTYPRPPQRTGALHDTAAHLGIKHCRVQDLLKGSQISYHFRREFRIESCSDNQKRKATEGVKGFFQTDYACNASQIDRLEKLLIFCNQASSPHRRPRILEIAYPPSPLREIRTVVSVQSITPSFENLSILLFLFNGSTLGQCINRSKVVSDKK